MLGVEVFLARIERLVHHAIFESDTSHSAPALTLDEYLTFLILVRTNLVAIEVVGTQVPFAIPAMLLHSLHHGVNALLATSCFVLERSSAFVIVRSLFQLLAEFDVIFSANHKQASNHQTLSLATNGIVFCSLETLVRVP